MPLSMYVFNVAMADLDTDGWTAVEAIRRRLTNDLEYDLEYRAALGLNGSLRNDGADPTAHDHAYTICKRPPDGRGHTIRNTYVSCRKCNDFRGSQNAQCSV